MSARAAAPVDGVIAEAVAADPQPERFAAAAVFTRVAARVPAVLPSDALDRGIVPTHGDHATWGTPVTDEYLAATRLAAVLIGLVAREDGVHVLLTKRSATLRDHSGQIAFPGGKMDPGDATPVATALRELGEEVGIPADRVDVLGYLGTYLTRTGFRIVPVVARIRTPFAMTLAAGEVDDAFEVPLAFLMNEANHTVEEKDWKGTRRRFYAMPYNERHIWGITAAMLRSLYERLYL